VFRVPGVEREIEREDEEIMNREDEE